MNFCCAAFGDRVDNAGQKGIAILPVKNPFNSNEYAYFLQSRDVDAGDESTKHTIIDLGILYCPWCGIELVEVTKENREVVAEIAEKTKKFIGVE